jgi:diguanylate cyclase (GGDEF)-like protein
VGALQYADSIKTTDNARFAGLLRGLDRKRDKLPPTQQWHLRNLDAWQAAYRGKFDKAAPLLQEVIEKSGDPELEARAGARLIDILWIGHHYEQAFSWLSQLLENVAGVSRDARLQILADASRFYIGAGQYALAADYAEQLVRENPSGPAACKGRYLVLQAQFHSHASPHAEPFLDGAALCVSAGLTQYANGIRADLARLYLEQHRARDAEALLGKHLVQIQHDRFEGQLLQFDSLLAQAHWQQHQMDQARDFAMAAVAANAGDGDTEPLVNAYRVLFEIEQARGHPDAALGYHEKYFAADKAYLDDISARAMAFQTVKQELQARKVEVDALARQNQILQLQQALDRKAVEAGRLYIVVLLLGLLAIGLWLLRLKRSQLQFMRMAQCDSLTGIYNRKHFMSEAEQVLRYAERSGSGASLLLIDLDHFKLINDTHGHAMGDQVLRRAVMACREHVRSTDVFGRLGGEEFGLLLPECSLDSGVERAEAIRRAITALSGQAEPGVPVSASFGVACTGETGHELRQLLMDADHALYRAKRAGRNCVVGGKAGEGVVVA